MAWDADATKSGSPVRMAPKTSGADAVMLRLISVVAWLAAGFLFFIKGFEDFGVV
jgi:hypothetical protein